MELVITTEMTHHSFLADKQFIKTFVFGKAGYNLYYNVMISQISMNAPHIKDLMNLVKTGILFKKEKKKKTFTASKTLCYIKADPIWQHYTSFWDWNLLKFI